MYTNNYPYNYGYYQAQPQQMPQQQVPQQPAQAQYQYYTYIVVNSEDEADRIPLDLNTQIFILDLNNGKAYVRKRDGLGQYSKEKFLVIKEDNAPASTYVTKEEFEAFKKSISGGDKE